MNSKVIVMLSFIIISFFSCEKSECKYDTECSGEKICSAGKCIDEGIECKSNSDCINSENCEVGKDCKCQFGYCSSKVLCDDDTECVQSCEEDRYCSCEVGVCVSSNPCSGITCSDNSKCVIADIEPFYSCECLADFHKERDNCISNIKFVSCKEDAPLNGKSNIVDVEIIWNSTTNSWSEPIECDWICDEGYHKDDFLCSSNTKQVDCIEKTPEHATSMAGKVNIIWDSETDSWSTPDFCDWTCDIDYTKSGSICVLHGWSVISRGVNHTCGIFNGAVYCWGSNTNGQLGLGDSYGDLPSCNATEKVCLKPQKVGNSHEWTHITTGARHSCGIKNGNLYCWGSNQYGELGLGILASRLNTPRKVNSILGEWIDVSSYGYNDEGHSCGINQVGTEKKLYCWGQNSDGQLGLGNKTVKNAPTQVGSGKNWLKISTGSFHTCGIRDDGIYCWGYNSLGQLGLNTIIAETIPKVVNNLEGWIDITSGEDSTCAIDLNKKAFCWGNNYVGQLGLGNSGEGTHKKIPTLIPAHTNWSSISLGKAHNCGIEENKLLCWGNNGNFELGLGNHDRKNTPTIVSNVIDWYKVSSGTYHTCAIAQNKKLFCWGNNTLGQLGVGDKEQKSTPIEVTITE